MLSNVKLTVLLLLAFAAGLLVGPERSIAAEPAPSNAATLPGNLVFGAGGMSGRFLYFEDWNALTNYKIHTVLEHSGDVWIAMSDPAVGDEPGLNALWEKVTNQSGGSGAQISSGTADPTGGSAGDAYVQVDTSFCSRVDLAKRGRHLELSTQSRPRAPAPMTRPRRKWKVTATGFMGNLGTGDTNVQTALASIDTLSIPTPPATARLVPLSGTTGHVLTKTTSGSEFAEVPGGTVAASDIIGAVTGTPGDTQIIKYDLTNTQLVWGDDNTAGGSMSDGVVTAASVTDHVMSLTRSESLSPVTVTLPFEVVEPSVDGTLRVATAADLNRIATDHGNLRVGTLEIVGDAEPIVGFEDYTATGFRGTAIYASLVQNPQDGDTVFATNDHIWFRRIGTRWTNTNATPANWIGWYHHAK